MTKEKWSTEEIENFIWDNICEAYKEEGEEGLDFFPILDNEEEESPDMEEFMKAIDYMEKQGHVEKRFAARHLEVQLTHQGKKECEGEGAKEIF